MTQTMNPPGSPLSIANRNGNSHQSALQSAFSHSTAVGRQDMRSPFPAKVQTLREARELIALDDRGKTDTLVVRRQLMLKDGDLVLPVEDDEAKSGSNVWDRLVPTAWAQGQLCARLGIPVTYFRGCPAVLQDQNANYWLRQGRDGKDYGEQWLLRSRHGALRAVLSSSYSPLDNATLLDALLPVLDHRYKLDWFALSDEGLHLRVVDPTRTREVLPDDALSVGVHITNSEVGKRSITVDALVYRLVCSNGLIALVQGKSLLRRRHIHIKGPRFVAALEEALSGAFGVAEEFLSRLEASTQQVVARPDTAIEKLGERWYLGEETQEAAKRALLREPSDRQHSAYALINAFTSAAQGLSDDKRYDLEVMAGEMARYGVPAFALSPLEKSVAVSLELPPPAWKRNDGDSGGAMSDGSGINVLTINGSSSQVNEAEGSSEFSDGQASSYEANDDSSRQDFCVVEYACQIFDDEVVGHELVGCEVLSREAVERDVVEVEGSCQSSRESVASGAR
jgi:hypothetical protein